jgi:hypothetical protein
MRYSLALDFEGSVRARTNNGWHVLDVAGSGQPTESAEPWRLAGQISWPDQLVIEPITGRLELGAPLDATLSASFEAGEIAALTDDGGKAKAWAPKVDFTVDKGTGWLEGTRGHIHVEGTVTAEGSRLSLQLDLAGRDDVAPPPGAGILRLEKPSGRRA